MGEVTRKVFLIKPERNKDPVAYVNIPAEIKRFYCFEKDGIWFADKVRVIFDEETGVMVVIPKWIDRKAEVGNVGNEAAKGTTEKKETEKVHGKRENEKGQTARRPIIF